ncbi:MFS transporter [Nocardioides sp.]|uniref:MFS transporter n=1 Tax=Nocardioides sp. TaxID=35761 RepID=UPI002E3172FD|nr:MFS transporter [Nocardioides sp.]
MRRLLVAYGCATLATGLPWPLLLVLVWDRYADATHGAWAVGLAGAARMAPYVLLSWAVGSLGDHVRRDRLLRATMVLRLAALGAAAVAVAGDRVGLAVALSAAAVLFGTPAYPAIAAALPELAGPRRARATESLVTIEVSSWVVGPALGGLLLADSLRAWTFPAAVALAATGLALSTGIGIPGPVERAPEAVAGMLRHVLHCRPALGALAVAGLLNLVCTVTGFVLLPLSEDAWHRGDAAFGLATACLGFGALGAPLLSRLATVSVPRGLLVIGGAVALVAATPVPWPALPLLALAGATAVVVESLLTGTLQDAVPDRYRAGALGVADSVMVGACLVGSLVAPALARHTGPGPALVLVALACPLPVLVVWLVPARAPATAYDAACERARPRHRAGSGPRSAAPVRAGSGSDPRGAPAVGQARVG